MVFLGGVWRNWGTCSHQNLWPDPGVEAMGVVPPHAWRPPMDFGEMLM